MLGGGLNGGKLMGNYPEDLSDKSDYWVRRGRMIPTVPFDSVWNGISQWMGVQGDDDLNFVLPNRINFEKCSRMFTGHDLFKNIPASTCINDADGDGVADESDRCPNTSYWLDAEVDEFGCQGPTTMSPTMSPVITSSPSSPPTMITAPVSVPTSEPTKAPTSSPPLSPTSAPTSEPTTAPTTDAPTSSPTSVPTQTSAPTDESKLVAVNSIIGVDTGTTLDRCTKAIDGTTNRCTISRNEFESKELAGFVAVATSGKSSIVKKIRVYNSNKCKFCDPTSYQIEGRNSESEDWKIISSGEIRLSRNRNQQGIPITSTYENGDLTRKFGESEIDNNMEYSQYKVTFPTSKNRRESKLRFAEVELPGFIYV